MPEMSRQIQAMQRHHWWWRGMAHLYRSVLHRFVTGNAPHRVLDIGCGYGANISVLEETGAVVGVDPSLTRLRAISQRPSLGLIQARGEALPFKAGTFNVVAALAVIEHIEDDQAAFAEFYRVACPGAIQLTLTSAFMVLWSHHDAANRHFRRYRAHQLDQAQQAAGWQVLLTSYVNTSVFLPALVVRLIQRRLKGTDAMEYDMGPDIPLVNSLLTVLLRIESALIVHAKIRLPFGVDLITVAKREQ